MPTVYYIGDSTVAFNTIATYPQTGMSQGLPRYLKDGVLVRPFGRNGRSTKSFLEEGHFRAVQAQLQPGDFLLIQFGHNDEKSDPKRYTAPFGSYQENLRFFLQTAREAGAYPVLITPIARRLFDEQGAFLPGSHGEYPQAVRELAKEENVPCADLTLLTETYLEQVGDAPSKPWFMWPKDNTHLKPEGAVIMAGFLARELKAFGGAYAQILTDFHKPEEIVPVDAMP